MRRTPPPQRANGGQGPGGGKEPQSQKIERKALKDLLNNSRALPNKTRGFEANHGKGGVEFKGGSLHDGFGGFDGFGGSGERLALLLPVLKYTAQ